MVVVRVENVENTVVNRRRRFQYKNLRHIKMAESLLIFCMRNLISLQLNVNEVVQTLLHQFWDKRHFFVFRQSRRT